MKISFQIINVQSFMFRKSHIRKKLNSICPQSLLHRFVSVFKSASFSSPHVRYDGAVGLSQVSEMTDTTCMLFSSPHSPKPFLREGLGPDELLGAEGILGYCPGH